MSDLSEWYVRILNSIGFTDTTFERRRTLVPSEFRQVYIGLRHAILSGALRKGERIPSTRDLAEQPSVSRTVVVMTYDQLLAEGFVSGLSWSETYVS